MQRIILTLLLAFALVAGRAAAQPAPDARASRVDSVFAKYDREPSPGLAIVVVQDGRVVLRRGYGLASMEHGVPITPETVFDVASVAKQFTGLTIAMLVAEGRIALDDDVRQYIPELPERGQPITIGQLVHHTSGIRDWPGMLSVAGWRHDDVITFDQILAMAYRQRMHNFAPGTEHLYSNTGYNLLAEVVARVTGQSLARWTEERLFRPLGMTRTHFRTDYREVIPDRAFGYYRASDGSYRVATDNLAAQGSSSLFSTVDDLGRWLINQDEGTVGGAAAHRLMRTPGRLADGSVVPYAFGILGGSYRDMAMFTHSGSWAAFNTYTVYMPDQRLGIAVLANSNAVDAQRAVIEIADVYLGIAPPAASADPRPDDRADTPPPAPRPSGGTSAFAQYLGTYESTELGTSYNVTLRADTLALVHVRHGRVPLVPVTPDEFTSETWFLRSIRFERDPAGRVSGIVVNGDPRNRDLRFSRRR
jgi:CubicO group peptidase (beta-lactamase class C family)